MRCHVLEALVGSSWHHLTVRGGWALSCEGRAAQAEKNHLASNEATAPLEGRVQQPCKSSAERFYCLRIFWMYSVCASIFLCKRSIACWSNAHILLISVVRICWPYRRWRRSQPLVSVKNAQLGVGLRDPESSTAESQQKGGTSCFDVSVAKRQKAI